MSASPATATPLAERAQPRAGNGVIPAGYGEGRLARAGAPALKAAAAFCYGVMALGQLIFAIYVAGFYGGALAQGNLYTWNKVLPHGYVAGDALGNLILAVHLAFAVVITLGGSLQLLPALRRRAPRLHRWNGRLYLFAALLLSLGGLVLLWTRDRVGDLPQHLAISLNALLILLFGLATLRSAVARRFDAHRRWALRLFLAVSGVWFFRVGLMFWLIANRGPAGFDPQTFSGPFLTFLAFAQYLLPLALLELYLRAQQSRRGLTKLATAALLALATLAMAAGIAGAALVMWLPRL